MAKEYSAKELEVQAQRAIDQLQPLVAVKFYVRAFELEPSAETAYTIASCAMEGGDLEDTYKYLKISLTLDGKQYDPFFQLGQLHVGSEAVEYYETGLNNLRPDLNSAESKRKFSNVLCSLAEIYMTDICDDDGAEDKCEKYMEEAFTVDPANPEVYSTIASLRLSQCRTEEAKKCLETGMSIWYVEPNENEVIPFDPNWPSLAARISLAKLLIEVSSLDRAFAVLETCQVEKDEDAEIWYLFGWCYLQEESFVDAKECFDNIIEVSISYKLNSKLIEMGDEQVPTEILEHTRELLIEITSKCAIDAF